MIMPKPKSIKKAYQDALIEFRNKHIKEMERNMEVAISIRDNPMASNKDRNEAVKIISRMLAGLQPERKESTQATAQQMQQLVVKLNASEIADIERRLGG